MEILLNQCQKVKTETRGVIENSNSSLSNALKEMKKYRQKINEIFDEMEKEIENEAKVLRQENNSRLKTTETLCDDMFKSMKILYDTMKQLNKSRQEDKLFVDLKSAQVVLENDESCMNDLSNVSNIATYDFELNKTIVKFLEYERSFGTIRPKQEGSSASAKQTNKKSQASRSRTLRPSRQGEINLKTSEDKTLSRITGITLLSPNYLVLADRDNKCIKMIDVNSKQIISRLPLPSKPWGITTFSSTEVVATLPDEQKIQFTSVFSNRFRETYSLNASGQCMGISCYQQKLVVTYINPGKLQILDMKGTVLTVSTNAKGVYIFSKPRHVAVNRKSIYVSDGGSANVIMLNWKGEVTGRYGYFTHAAGITLTEGGTIYVCDNNENDIEEISADCSEGHVVVKDLVNPGVVSWSDDKDTLYVSSTFTGAERYCDFIKVIKIS